MTPWTKERRMQEVVRWMFDDNPDLWYLPEAITKVNSAGQTLNLTFPEATEIFGEMEQRGFLTPVKTVIPAIGAPGNPGYTPAQQVTVWMLDRAATSDIHEFLQAGSNSVFWRSLKRFVWDDEDKRWGYVIVIVGAFVGGFCVKAGEEFFDLLKSCASAIGRWMLG